MATVAKRYAYRVRQTIKPLWITAQGEIEAVDPWEAIGKVTRYYREEADEKPLLRTGRLIVEVEELK